MACGACGGKRPETEYEVTFRDGSKKRVSSLQEVRIELARDTTVGRAQSYKAVNKASKTL
jgi:hypothetical protein